MGYTRVRIPPRVRTSRGTSVTLTASSWAGVDDVIARVTQAGSLIIAPPPAEIDDSREIGLWLIDESGAAGYVGATALVVNTDTPELETVNGVATPQLLAMPRAAAYLRGYAGNWQLVHLFPDSQLVPMTGNRTIGPGYAIGRRRIRVQINQSSGSGSTLTLPDPQYMPEVDIWMRDVAGNASSRPVSLACSVAATLDGVSLPKANLINTDGAGGFIYSDGSNFYNSVG